MGLITKEVEVILGARNLRHLESLGYDIPRHKKKSSNKMSATFGATILVKVQDLLPCSKVIVTCECDECKKEIVIPYYDYTNRTIKDGGLTYCQSCAAKIANSGTNNYQWDYSKTQEERELSRAYPEYKEFIKKVLARDHYTCQCCGNYSKDLDVHHLNSYNWYIEGRTDEINGITLCKECHKNFHLLYGYGDNTKEQYENFVGYTVDPQKYNELLTKRMQMYCIEEDKIYDNPDDFAKQHNCSSELPESVCRKYNRTAKGLHLLWLEEYEKMTEKDFEEYFLWANENNHSTKVICITTNQIYNSIELASRENNIAHVKIVNNCQRKYARCHNRDGIELQFMYYDDWVKHGEYFIENNEINITKNNGYAIVCLNTGCIFESLQTARQKYLIPVTQKRKPIKVEKNGVTKLGKDENGNDLYWVRYKEFWKDMSRKEREDFRKSMSFIK